MKTLAGRRLSIARGETDLPAEKVAEYVTLWRAQGYEVPEPPAAVVPFLTKLVSFGKAAARHVAKGFPKPPPEEIERRRAICATCPKWRNGMCSLCGCPTKAKTAWAGEKCPDDPSRWDRWEPPAPNQESTALVPLELSIPSQPSRAPTREGSGGESDPQQTKSPQQSRA